MHFTAMSRNLERMRAALTEWMTKEEILGDAFFVDIEAWRVRNEPYGNDSLLVLVFDSSTLHTMLNYGGDTTEFDDLVESFGFWYELGHSWNMGFYPIEGYDYSRLPGTYASKLQDERWRKKAATVKERAGHQCQDCGDVPLVLSSTANWSPIPQSEEIGREEALFRRADHWLPA
ncbi:hypothetical protein [Pseudomonas aeruginosa]|uniref:hypothetical protein n=1 Tax=Pseudomonas aeruginosa TaxID=287 RepID=UPI001968EFED|nr:hypothetical protein [Pseudomonas aeruginosa]